MSHENSKWSDYRTKDGWSGWRATLNGEDMAGYSTLAGDEARIDWGRHVAKRIDFYFPKAFWRRKRPHGSQPEG